MMATVRLIAIVLLATTTRTSASAFMRMQLRPLGTRMARARSISITNVVESLLKAGLSETTYPNLGGDPVPVAKRKPPTEIILFVLGGVTYEEARFVAEMNTANPGVKVLLGTTTRHP